MGYLCSTDLGTSPLPGRSSGYFCPHLLLAWGLSPPLRSCLSSPGTPIGSCLTLCLASPRALPWGSLQLSPGIHLLWASYLPSPGLGHQLASGLSSGPQSPTLLGYFSPTPLWTHLAYGLLRLRTILGSHQGLPSRLASLWFSHRLRLHELQACLSSCLGLLSTPQSHHPLGYLHPAAPNPLLSVSNALSLRTPSLQAAASGYLYSHLQPYLASLRDSSPSVWPLRLS